MQMSMTDTEPTSTSQTAANYHTVQAAPTTSLPRTEPTSQTAANYHTVQAAPTTSLPRTGQIRGTHNRRECG